MSPTELEEYVLQHPVPPLRLTLSSGDQLVIDEADRPFIQGLSLILRASVTDGRAEGGTGMVSIPNIALVERLLNKPPARSRRRR